MIDNFLQSNTNSLKTFEQFLCSYYDNDTFKIKEPLINIVKTGIYRDSRLVDGVNVFSTWVLNLRGDNPPHSPDKLDGCLLFKTTLSKINDEDKFRWHNFEVTVNYHNGSPLRVYFTDDCDKHFNFTEIDLVYLIIPIDKIRNFYKIYQQVQHTLEKLK